MVTDIRDPHRDILDFIAGQVPGTLWFIAHIDRGIAAPLCRYRPWYRQKWAPSQLDIVEACREALHETGIFPIPQFIPELGENQEELDNVLPLAA